MEYKDYYQVLGVPRTASQAEIRKAYRKLAREHHPDIKPGDTVAERRFKEINEANAVLSDAAKRKQYDTLGANWEAYSRAGGNPFAAGGPFAGFGGFAEEPGQGGNPAGGRVRYEFRSGGDAGGFSDFFRTFFAGAAGAEGGESSRGGSRRSSTSTRSRAGGGSPSFEEILGEMGLDGSTAGGASRSTGSRRGAPAVEAAAELDLEEAFHGTSRIVEVGGKRLEVTIPRGVDNGSRIRLTGKGGDGRDLFVVTNIRPHRVFTRRGADLERELVVTLGEALLGAEVPVTTLRGKVLLRIPAGTQTGRTFRLKGQGMPRLGGEGAGDLYVKLRTVLPTDLSPEASEAAQRFVDLAAQPDPRATTA